MVLGRKGLGATLAVLAAVMLVLSGLFASPARAQATPDSVVVDLVVETEQGECGEGDCADDERPVTFDVVAEVNAGQNVPLTEAQRNDINAALAAADFGITVEDPDGGPQEIEDGQTLCWEARNAVACGSRAEGAGNPTGYPAR